MIVPPCTLASAVLGLMMAVVVPAAGAGTSGGTEAEQAEDIRGAIAFARDGTELGEVSRVVRGEDGEPSEVHIKVAARLGIGERTVAVPAELVITLRGAVVVELTAGEVARLRSAGPD